MIMQCGTQNGNALSRGFNPNFIAFTAEAFGGSRYSAPREFDETYFLKMPCSRKTRCDQRAIVFLCAHWMPKVGRRPRPQRLACHHWSQRKLASRADTCTTLYHLHVMDITRFACPRVMRPF
jgi:hypothetical protein